MAIGETYYVAFQGTKITALYGPDTPLTDIARPFIHVDHKQYVKLCSDPAGFYVENNLLKERKQTEEELVLFKHNQRVTKFRTELREELAMFNHKGVVYPMDNGLQQALALSIACDEKLEAWVIRDGQYKLETLSSKESKALGKAFIIARNKNNARENELATSEP